MGGVVTKEEAINRAQYLDLVYSQMGTLCDLILDALCLSTNPTPTLLVASHVVDGVIGSSISHSESKSYGVTLLVIAQNPPSTPLVGSTSELNAIQSSKGKYQ